MLIAILTGLTAGGLHVVGGADHLLAMAPLSFRSPAQALKNGLAWGAGHSVGILLLAGLGVALRDLIHLEAMSSLAELFVGVALLVVGGLAIRSAFGLQIHSHRHQHAEGSTHDHVHFHVRGLHRHRSHGHASASLGLLHGMAGGGHLLAVMPALALPPLDSLGYLLGYFFGGVASMLVVVLILSLSALRAGQRALPRLIFLAGSLSIATGCIWLHRSMATLF